MATHSSILAWKISWTEKPGGLQFMGLRRVRHDWVRGWKNSWLPGVSASEALYLIRKYCFNNFLCFRTLQSLSFIVVLDTGFWYHPRRLFCPSRFSKEPTIWGIIFLFFFKKKAPTASVYNSNQKDKPLVYSSRACWRQSSDDRTEKWA